MVRVGWYISLGRSTCQTSWGGGASAYKIGLSKDSVKQSWNLSRVWPGLHTYLKLLLVFHFKYFNSYTLNMNKANYIDFYCCFCSFTEQIGYFQSFFIIAYIYKRNYNSHYSSFLPRTSFVSCQHASSSQLYEFRWLVFDNPLSLASATHVCILYGRPISGNSQ